MTREQAVWYNGTLRRDGFQSQVATVWLGTMQAFGVACEDSNGHLHVTVELTTEMQKKFEEQTA